MHHQYRQIVVLEGNIGAGKTTLARALAADSAKIDAEYERVGPALQAAFYADPRANAFGMEMAQSCARAASLRFHASHLHSRARRTLLLLDRSIIGSMAFAAASYALGSLNDAQYAAFCETNGSRADVALHAALSSTSSKFQQRRTIVVHVRAPPERCLANARARGSPDANSLTLDYLNIIAAAHELVFALLRATASVHSRFDIVELTWDEYASASNFSVNNASAQQKIDDAVIDLIHRRASAWRQSLIAGTLPSMISDECFERVRSSLARISSVEIRQRLVATLLPIVGLAKGVLSSHGQFL